MTRISSRIGQSKLSLKNNKVLFVLTEAKARIDGPSNKEVHVKQRSQVKLTCVVDISNSGEFFTGIY